MNTIYFHIGMHKTGSSAFQQYCFAHRDALASAGLAYPRLPFANHSHFLEAQFVADRQRVERALATQNQQRLLDERDAMRRDFEADIREALSGGRDMIVSGENATHFKPEDVAAAAAFFGALADRVVILGLVRPPMAFTTSIVQQALRGGGRMIEDFADAPARPQYAKRFAPFLESFGDVRLRLFRDDTLVAGCALPTLVAMMDGERPALRDVRADRVNQTMNMTAAKFFSLANESLRQRRFVPELPAEVRAALSTGSCGAFFEAAFSDKERTRHLPPTLRLAVTAVPGGEQRFALPREIAERIPALAGEDTEWMSRVLGTEIADFNTDAIAAAPSLDAFRQFDGEEVAALVTVIEGVNAQAHEPVATDPGPR